MKKALKKSVMLMLALTMFMSIFASYPVVGSAATPDDDKTEYQKFTTNQGQIAVEWEKVLVNGSTAKKETAKEASGRKHVRLNGVNTTKPTPDTPGDAGFELTFDRDGKYIVWVRYMTMDGNSDSFWLDYGYEEWGTHERGYIYADLKVHSQDASDYLWKRVGNVQMKAGETIKIRASVREPNCVIDKIIFTTSTMYEPEGTGKLPDTSDVYAVAKMPEDRYPIPAVTPTVGEHPRVLFKKEDIPRIKANMQTPEMARITEFFNEYKEKEYSGILPDVEPNYDAPGLEIIAAKALDYALFGNEENGKQAISAIKNVAETTRIIDDTCMTGHVLKVVGQVYDWCYPLLSSEDKKILMHLAQLLSLDMEVEFPPDAQTMLCGHGAEMQLYRDWLTMAIACYDEYPDAYNLVAGKIFSPDSVEYRNWWNQSGTHSQGTYYPLIRRYKSELYAHILIKKMSGGYELFNEDDLINIAYDWIYRRRPDGMLMIDGDDNLPNQMKKGTYETRPHQIMFLAAAISEDSILKREFFYTSGFDSFAMSREAVTPIDMLVLNNPTVSTDVAIGTLPLTEYHPSPVGEMIARTGWDMGMKSPNVVATMTISEYNGMNHAHYDCGHFMIYYKGILANDSGWYEKHDSNQHKNYMAQSISHNTLVIETPYNKWGNQNQGIDGPTKTNVDGSSGKNFYWIPKDWNEYQTDEQNRWAEIMGHEYGPDLQYPEYSYLAGDLANAYTSKYDDGVNEALRHMIFLPTGNEKNPAVFIVFDKIDTKVGGKKKAFLLHSEEEPEVSGNITTIKRTKNGYNGKLVNQTLLPAADNLKINKIGGVEFDENGNVITETDRRFWNKGQNWFTLQDSGQATGTDSSRKVNATNSLEAGWGRVEIMPKNSNKVDYLLNVMYVGDADDNSPVEKATLIEAGKFIGARIFDRVVMFNTEKARIDDAVSFVVPDIGDVKINVAGLKAGTWNVSVDGKSIDNQVASEDGGIIYFTAPAGSVTLKYVSGDANKTFTQSAAPELEGVTLYYNDNFLYSDVPPTVRDGRTLVPMRAILEAMDAEVSWDEASATATAYDGYTEIKITENQKTAYVDGEPVELDVPAQIINGRFVIPVRFVAESLGAKVSWDEFSKKVKIVPNKGQKVLKIENIIKIADAKMSGYNNYEGYEIQASYDGDFNSYWSVSSDGQDVWGIYDFGNVKTLDKLLVSYTQSNARSYKFDIEVSEDGVNFTPLLTGMETSTANPVGEFEEFDLKGANARYVRLLEHGNSTNKWNTLAEIVFTEKK